MITIEESVRKKHPTAKVGLLLIENAPNLPSHAGLERAKQELEDGLRQQYAGYQRADLKRLPVLKICTDYLKKYKKTYHVLLQLESVVNKGRSIPTVSTLVEAMFMGELKNQMPTAVHDWDKVVQPLGYGCADGTETFITNRGEEKTLKPDDLYVADAAGIISDFVYGRDGRTEVTEATDKALYVTYGLPGMEESLVFSHLQDIKDYLKIVYPQANFSEPAVF